MRLLYVVCPILDLVTCIVITSQCVYNLLLFVVVFIIDVFYLSSVTLKRKFVSFVSRVILL